MVSCNLPYHSCKNLGKLGQIWGKRRKLYLVTLISEDAGRDSQFRKWPPKDPERTELHCEFKTIARAPGDWRLGGSGISETAAELCVLCFPSNVKKASTPPTEEGPWDHSPKEAGQGGSQPGLHKRSGITLKDLHLGTQRSFPRGSWMLKKWISQAALLVSAAVLHLFCLGLKVSENAQHRVI